MRALLFSASMVVALTGDFLRAADPAPYAPAKDTLVYVGTYTVGKTTSRGIYLFRLQTPNDASANIVLQPLGLAAESVDPAFLALDEKHRRVFAVNEIDNFDGGRTGSVTAFAINPVT